MDKSTLSNYGWIVIAVLVLSVMIALATPFGEYIKAGVESTTAGLFDTSEKALNVVGMSAKEKDVLKGNNIAVFGTSVSSGMEDSPVTYCMKLAEDNDMELKNIAKGNKDMIYALSRYKAHVDLNTFESYSENDFIIIEGLLNSATRLELGEITPDGTATFDETTTIGTLESIFYHYTNSGYKAKIGFILTHFSYHGYNDAELNATYNNVWDAAITVFEKYDIPYLDLRDIRSTGVSTVDGVHPDDAGHTKMAELVESWLRTL